MCQLMHVGPDDYIGKSDFDFFPENEARVFWQKDNEVFLSKSPVENEEVFTDGEGVTHTILTKKVASRLDDGQLILIGIIRDITERKLAEGELAKGKATAEHENEMKGRFLTNITHELRTPMNGVLGMLSLLQKTSLSDEQTGIVQCIQHSGELLLDIINQILDSSALSNGSMAIYQEEVNVIEVCRQCLKLVEQTHTEHGNHFFMEVAADVPNYFMSDSKRLSQILMNVLSNANKFTRNGSIHLSLSCDQRDHQRFLVFKVRDTGPGISKHELQSIFNRFSQLDNLSTRVSTGTGLGLAICKQLCELLQGSIRVESELGKGSVFFIELLQISPMAKNDSSAVENSSSLEKVTFFRDNAQLETQALEKCHKEDIKPIANEYPLKILVAEDNIVNQKVISGMLKLIGYDNPTLVDNGRKAVLELLDKQYDLVFMDINMPEVDGIEATRILRERAPNFPQLYVVALTSNTGDSEAARFQKVGMKAHISKPYSISALQAVIKDCYTQRP
jgi:signal transduction histidine kinase